MSPTQSVSSFFNHKVDAVNKFIDNVAKSPGTTKKVLQVFSKSFKTYDLYTLKKHFPEFYADAKGAIEFIEVYGFFKDIVYWVNPFTNNSLDRKKLTESLDAFLKKHDLPFPSLEKIEARSEQTRFSSQQVAEHLFAFNQELMNKYAVSDEIQNRIKNRFTNLSKRDSYSKSEVLDLFDSLIDTVNIRCSRREEKTAAGIVKEALEGGKEHYTPDEVLETLKEKLLKNGYSFIAQGNHFEELKKELTIQQIARPLVQRVYMLFFTAADFGTVLLIFQKWNFIDLANLSTKIGSQSPVFAFVIKAGSDAVLGTIASAGLVFVLGEAIYHSVDEGWQYFNATDPALKSKALKNCIRHLFEAASAGTDLAINAAPLVFVVSPQTILILAVVSKGTALIAIFMR